MKYTLVLLLAGATAEVDFMKKIFDNVFSKQNLINGDY